MYRVVLLSSCSLLVIMAGCIDTSQQTPVPPGGKATTVAALDPWGPLPIPREQLVYLGGAGSGLLPQHETEWEKRMKRLARSGGPSGDPLVDQFDDYRDTHIDSFFVTQPPATSGIRVPAEYEPSQAVLLKWATVGNADLDKMYGDIVQAVWGVVPLLMIFQSPGHESMVNQQLMDLGYTSDDLADTSKLIGWAHASDAIWARDFGPIGILDPSDNLSFVDFRYYHFRVNDDCVPTDLAQDWGINVFRPDLDLEGGNFMATDDGLCASTKAVLYANANLAISAVEEILQSYLGCKGFLFPEPMLGEVPHIDLYAKFGPDGGVLVGQYAASQDPTNQVILDANAALFSGAKTPAGMSLTVTRIPMPDQPQIDGKPVYLTYTNALALSNGSDKLLLIPTYANDATQEAAALQAFSQVYPGWTQVTIDSEVTISWGGAVHCITMQIPQGNRTQMEAEPLAQCSPDKWECAESGCGPINAEGCCYGNTVVRCDDGALIVTNCGAMGNPMCGWSDADGHHACGTDGQADPSGTHPLTCDLIYGDGGIAPADGALPDLGPAMDQGEPPHDAGVASDGGERDDDQDEDGGCSCGMGAIGPETPSWPLVVLILLVLCLVRRRR